MSLMTSLYARKERKEEQAKEALEDFMTLIRVYYQSVMAVNLGITNFRMLPDLTTYKRIFKIATQDGKLGLAEKSHTKKLLMQNYGISDSFFKEIDQSIKKNCKTQNDVATYLYMFQDFSNTLFMVVGNLMKWKFNIPTMFNKLLMSLTAKTVHDVVTKRVWKDAGVSEAAQKVKIQSEKLIYSEAWMTEYVFKVVMVSKSKRK